MSLAAFGIGFLIGWICGMAFVVYLIDRKLRKMGLDLLQGVWKNLFK